MDLSSGFDIPNPFGLLAADFGHDIPGYRAALGFLSDLAGGSEHDEALVGNGGDPGSLTRWQQSAKFRRVYAKCRAAGDGERALRAAHEAAEATSGPEADVPSGQRFVPLESLPARRGGRVFATGPAPASWGGP